MLQKVARGGRAMNVLPAAPSGSKVHFFKVGEHASPSAPRTTSVRWRPIAIC